MPWPSQGRSSGSTESVLLTARHSLPPLITRLVMGPITGMVDPAAQIRRLAEAGVDAILMNLGMVSAAADSMLVERPPALIVRLDWTSLWTAEKSDGKLCSRQLGSVEQAVRPGADAVLTYVFVGTGDAQFEGDEVARECESLGVPMIVESLARGPKVHDPLDIAVYGREHASGPTHLFSSIESVQTVSRATLRIR